MTEERDNKLFLDLFAGAGGLSEGFIQAGFSPLAHVEMDEAACFTLKTRLAYHWLKNKGLLNIYADYLDNKISRDELYSQIPQSVLSSVICSEISQDTVANIFVRIDLLLDNKKLDLIVGGPPCQAYSIAGRSRDKNGMRGDKRNYLYEYYVEFLKKYQPKYFVFENVMGLLSAKDADGNYYLEAMKDAFIEAGYSVNLQVLSANEFGVPQRRKRVILVGNSDGNDNFFPYPDKWNPEITVGDIFSDLPILNAGDGSSNNQKLESINNNYLIKSGIRSENGSVTLHVARPHNSRDLEIYRIAVDKWDKEQTRIRYDDLPSHLKTHKNQTSFTDRFKVVAGNLPTSHTVVAHIAKDGHYYIHPDINQNRSLTPREAARLQTFPDDYYFEGKKDKSSRTAAFKQIGNAVPVLLARKIAEKLLKIWL